MKLLKELVYPGVGKMALDYLESISIDFETIAT